MKANGHPDVDVWPAVVSFTIERDAVLCAALLEGEPLPWSRAGRGRSGQTYTPRRYLEHRNALGHAMLAGRIPHHAVNDELGMLATFARSTRRRVDIDNLLKAVLDAGNNVVWADDAQLSVALVRVVVDRENPRTELVVFRRELPDRGVPGVRS